MKGQIRVLTVLLTYRQEHEKYLRVVTDGVGGKRSWKGGEGW